MQLLFTFDFPPIGGGIARFMAELARHYPPGSLVVSTGQHEGSLDVDRQFPNRVDRLSVPAHRLRTVQGLFRWSRRAVALARAENAEFIWCGNLKPAAYPARWVRRRVGTPFGVILHGADLLMLQQQVSRSALKRRAARGLLGAASVLVANSQWTRERCLLLLRELVLPSDAARVQVVPLGTDPAFFRPGIDSADVRARYGLGDGRWLLSVARLTEHKGIDTVIRALAMLGPSDRDVSYAVVGSGDDQPRLEALARGLGVADRVRFLTRVPDRDLPALYNVAHIYLGMSRLLPRSVEGFGISLVEASACGRPVIAGRSGGIPDAVRDGETGLLVDAERPDAVAAAIARLLDDPELADRLGHGGRRAVETYYNWNRVAADLQRIGAEAGR